MAHVLFGLDAHHVDRVWVGGRLVVEGGRMVAIDSELEYATAQREATGLWRRMASL